MRSVIVLTGSTGGIGAAAADALSLLDVHLVLVGRRRDALEAQCSLLERHGATVSMEVADLSLMDQVRALGERLTVAYPEISVLLHNAGVYRAAREETAEGLERTFAVNVCAPFVLTHGLSASLLRGAPSRVVFVASEAHRGHRLDFADLQHTDWPTLGGAAYARSKLAMLLLTRELSRRFEGSGVSCNAMHPGTVRTSIAAGNGLLMRVASWVVAPFSRAPSRGADTLVWLARARDLEGVSGSYFMDRRIRTPDRSARDDDAAHRLWNQLERLTGVVWQPV